MLIKEVGQTYDNLPDEVKSSMLALSILIDRIGSLPKADRDDLFQLLQEWRKADEPEEQQSIRRAVEEILAQLPVNAKHLSLSNDRGFSGRRKSWAEHVGATIRTLRESAGLTQVQLAEKSGLPQSHISRLENAEYGATNLTLTKIAKALRVSVGKIDPSTD